MNKRLKSTLILLTTAIIWGFAFVAQLKSTSTIGALSFSSIRFLIGAISLVPVFLIFEKEKITKDKIKSTIIYGIITGVVLFIASTLQHYGVMLTNTAGKAGMITGLYIILVPILGLLWGKKTSKFVWAGGIIALIGLYFLLLYGEDTTICLGDVLLFIGAFFWAGHIIVIDKFVDKVYPLKYSCIQFLTTGILATIFALFFEQTTITDVTNSIWPILYCGLLSCGVAYTFQIIGQKDEDPAYCSIILSTESLFAAIGELIILHQKMSISGYIGCILIFSGIIISQLKERKNNV